MYKVYGPAAKAGRCSTYGEYLASCHEAQDAVLVATRHGIGSTIRWGHMKIVWRIGEDAVFRIGPTSVRVSPSSEPHLIAAAVIMRVDAWQQNGRGDRRRRDNGQPLTPAR